MVKISVQSLEETKALAYDLVACFQKEVKLYLDGDLGAGKTTFSSFLLEAFGVKHIYGSPTYALVNEYVLPSQRLLRHFDLYRLTEDEFLEQGFLELLEEQAYALVEWASLMSKLLPKKALNIYIEKPELDAEGLADFNFLSSPRVFCLKWSTDFFEEEQEETKVCWQSFLSKWSK